MSQNNWIELTHGEFCVKFHDDKCKGKVIVRKFIFSNQCIVNLNFDQKNQ